MGERPAAARIRLAKPDDLTFIDDCTRAAYAKYIARLGRKPQPMTRDYWDPVVAGEVWILEAGEEPAGLIVLASEPDQLLIYSLAVTPEHQGRGFGGRLLRFAEAEARRQGLERIRLYTNARMTENIKLYEKSGYRETHREPFEDSAIVHMARRSGAPQPSDQ